MTDEQASLATFGGGAEEETDPDGETPRGNVDGSGIRKDVLAYKSMADNAEPQNRFSCPWCCAPPSDFNHNDNGTTGCGNCHAVIPVDADWYKSGKKIVI